MDIRVDATAVLIGGAIAAVALIVWRSGERLNPANPNNIVNQAFERVGQDISGNPDWSLGVWLYETLHPHEKYQNFPETAPLWWRLENPEYYSTDTIMDGLSS